MDDRESNPKPKKGKSTGSPIEKLTCGKCGKKQYGDCLKRTDNCFGCGKSGHKVRDFPNVRGQDNGSGQDQASYSNKAPKKNHFNAHRSRGEQETSPDVVTGILKVLSIYVYALLDPVATLSIVTPVGESVVAKRVYKNCPIMLLNRVSYVDLVELDKFDFDIILGMDWLHACFASINYRKRVVRFNFPNKHVVEWKGGNSIPRCRIISCL